MKYKNINTQEILTYKEIKIANPNISFPKDGTSTLMEEWELIQPTTAPEYNYFTEKLVEGELNLVQTWTIEPLPQAEIDANAADKLIYDTQIWKADREDAVRAIEVTYNSIIYQGDEESQTRMARAIVALPDDITTIAWTAKDNTVNNLTRLDLQAILLDAGNQQATIWNTGRPA
jgi:hypothetical protein